MKTTRIAARHRFGFTLVELMVVVSVIGILSAIVYANFGGARAVARDDIRKTDLKNLQVAIQLYKAQNGSYPTGCNGGAWSSGSAGTFACSTPGDDFIVGLRPDFIATLPVDPKLTSSPDSGLLYKSNGTDYKLMSNLTVEQATISSGGDEFARCPAVSGGCASGIPAKTYAVYSAGAAQW